MDGMEAYYYIKTNKNYTEKQTPNVSLMCRIFITHSEQKGGFEALQQEVEKDVEWQAS